ncbi:unnamed protein product, partial [Gulo gulo]
GHLDCDKNHETACLILCREEQQRISDSKHNRKYMGRMAVQVPDGQMNEEKVFCIKQGGKIRSHFWFSLSRLSRAPK